LPGSQPGFSVQLSRGGSDAYLLFPINQAGGGPDITVLYRSSDDGGTWQRGTEPCPQVGGPVDAIDVAAAPDGRVSVLCSARDQSRYFVATSTDGGAHFDAQSGSIPESAGGSLAGDPATVLGAGGSRQLAVSTNGGRSWTTAPGVTGNVTFVGFESNTVGRVVTGGNTIWTTRDAGQSWTPVTFG
jgi:BNR/Asp-box repeat.